MNDKPSRDVAVFAAALDLPSGERADYLTRECGDDHALRARVEALLRADSEAGNFMEEPLGTPQSQSLHAIGEKPGDRIGRYKLLQQIGEGGCGVVFMAEQEASVALASSVELATQRYVGGRSSYYEVLQAQQELYPTQRAQVQAQVGELVSVIQLYKALGGGWQTAPQMADLQQ